MKKIQLFVEMKGDLGRMLKYYLVVEEVETSDFFCEQYGVAVETDEGDYQEILGITLLQERIEALLALLSRNQVSPIALCDVVADWL